MIFPAEYKLPITIEEGNKRFTPSIEDITKSETFLLSNASEIKYEGLTGIYQPDKLKKTLCKYNRQYIGYKTAASDSIIFIHLLNFKNKKKAKVNFADWQNSYIIGFDDFYEKNMVTMLVNLSEKKVSLR